MMIGRSGSHAGAQVGFKAGRKHALKVTHIDEIEGAHGGAFKPVGRTLAPAQRCDRGPRESDHSTLGDRAAVHSRWPGIQLTG